MPRRIAAIIRHGDYFQLQDTPSAWQPYPLNSEGEQHAQDAVLPIMEFMSTQKLDIHPFCHSSQLLRAWQTAEIICSNLSQQLSLKQALQLKSFDALAERSVGSVANLDSEEIRRIAGLDPRYPELPEDWKSNSNFRLPFQGAESLMEAGVRVAEHINESIREMANKISQDNLMLFVGHGAAFRHAAHHMGVLEFNQIAKLSMYHGSPVFLELHENGRWEHIAGTWKVRTIKTEYKD